MYKYEDQKELRRAINGKTIVMLVGIMLIFTAVTSTTRLAMSCFGIAGEAANGVEEYVNWLEAAKMTISQLRVAGAVFGIGAVVEIFAGVFCVKLCNRLDTSKLCLKIAIGLLVVEVLVQVYMLSVGLAMPSTIFSALAFPLMLLWGVSCLRKLAKKYPDRKYAMEPRPSKKKAVQPQKKNLMERAKAQVTDEDAVSRVVEEISDAEETETEETE
ncbi:MAG: hypothetical protein KH828_12825 [Clostridiales bacterium]|nr:hypothetical protein [Clostridiales bacterium]